MLVWLVFYDKPLTINGIIMAQKDEFGLTSKQRVFCDSYLSNGLNAAQAYRAAYPKCESEGAARTNAARMLTVSTVVEHIIYFKCWKYAV